MIKLSLRFYLKNYNYLQLKLTVMKKHLPWIICASIYIGVFVVVLLIS